MRLTLTVAVWVWLVATNKPYVNKWWEAELTADQLVSER